MSVPGSVPGGTSDETVLRIVLVGADGQPVTLGGGAGDSGGGIGPGAFRTGSPQVSEAAESPRHSFRQAGAKSPVTERGGRTWPLQSDPGPGAWQSVGPPPGGFSGEGGDLVPSSQGRELAKIYKDSRRPADDEPFEAEAQFRDERYWKKNQTPFRKAWFKAKDAWSKAAPFAARGVASRAAYAAGASAGTSRVVGTAAGFAVAGTGPAGQLVAAGAVASVALIGFGTAVKKVTDSIIERGRELAYLSPELTASGARRSVREFGADVREANKLGPTMARLEDSWSKLEVLVRDGLLPIKQFIYNSLASFLELVLNFIDYIRPIWVVIDKLVDMLVSAAGHLGQMDLKGALEDLRSLPENIKNAISRKDLEKDADMILNQFMNLGKRASNVNREPDVIERARSERIGVPSFAGL